MPIFSGFSSRRLRALVVACLATLQGCAGQPVGGPSSSGASGSSADTIYQVNVEYNKAFTAIQSALAESARIGISDRQTGMIQGQAGAAKTITVKVARANLNTTFKVDVVNIAGVWALLDRSDDAKAIADRVSATLGVAVTSSSQTLAAKKLSDAPSQGQPSAQAAPPAAQHGLKADAPAPAAPAPKAPEAIQYGGYEWLVVSKSEGGIKVQTKGMPKDQDALDVASAHCKKFGRVAQVAQPRKLVLFTFNLFAFNCAR